MRQCRAFSLSDAGAEQVMNVDDAAWHAVINDKERGDIG